MEKNTSYPSYIGHGLVAWCIKNVYFYDGYTNVVSYKNENMQLKTMSTVEVINWVLLSSKGNSGHKIFTFFQFSLWPFQKMGLYLKFCVWHFMQTNYCKVQSRIIRHFFKYYFTGYTRGLSTLSNIYISISYWLIHPRMFSQHKQLEDIKERFPSREEVCI